jgi:hypothetical protein
MISLSHSTETIKQQEYWLYLEMILLDFDNEKEIRKIFDHMKEPVKRIKKPR